MTHVVPDRVADTTSTTGTGAFILNISPPTGYKSFGAKCADGDTVWYSVSHRTLDQWEVGKGTYGAGTGQLTRTEILASSNADGVVNFSSGIKDIYAGMPGSALTAVASISTFGASLIDDANAAAARATLGLGTAAVQNIGTSGANVPLLSTANAWGAVQTVAGGVGITATSPFTVQPTGNTPDTLASLNVQGNRQSGSVREFMINLGMTQTTGHGASSYNVDGVTLYVGHDAQTNTGDGWAFNLVTSMAANIAHTGHHFHGAEFDFNNFYADYTTLSPLACALSLTGAGTKLSSTALLITGTQQSLGVDPIWTMGIALVANSIRDFGILDTTNAAFAHYIGGTKTHGIDTSSATFAGYAINLGVGHVIGWNSGDVTVTHSANALAFAGASSGYSFDARILAAAGDAGTPSISFSGDSDTGFYSPFGNGLGISVGGFARAFFGTGELSPASNDGLALGSGSFQWSDLNLASGAVVSFNGGDVLITHSANALAFTGASSGYSFDALVTSSVAGVAGRFVNTTDSASVQGVRVEGDRATPTAADEVYASFMLSNSTGTQTEFARLTTIGNTVTAAGEVGRVRLSLVSGGVLTNQFVIAPGVIFPSANDGIALGTSSLSFADLFLASGAVINLNNGDVTITHSSNTLTFAGASSGYSFDAYLRLANTVPVKWRNAANNADIVGIYLDASNNVQLGDGVSVVNINGITTGGISIYGEGRFAGDSGGGVGQNSFTSVSDLTANSIGIGTILFKGTTSRNSAGFIKIYIGTTPYYLPAFAAITG